MLEFRSTMNKSPITNYSISTENPLEDNIVPPSAVQFWTFLLFEIPSLACTIFLLFHLLTNPQLRRALHNHVIIIFLFLTFCIEVFDNPLYVDAYHYQGHNSFQMTEPVCLMWWLIDFGFYGAISVFLALASVERHILIFHYHQLLRTPRQRFVMHYFPLIITSIYIFGFYIGVIFFPPCKNEFDFQSLGCGLMPCYTNIPYLNTWDYLGNGIICTFIETTSSIALLIRVLWQKHLALQRVKWQRHRKMSFQLLSISCLSLTIIFPQSLIVVIQQTGGTNTNSFGAAALPYFNYLYTFVVFLLPFILLGSYPELWPKLLFFRSKRRQPPLMAITHMRNRDQMNVIRS